jgi:hypothetical protein
MARYNFPAIRALAPDARVPKSRYVGSATYHGCGVHQGRYDYHCAQGSNVAIPRKHFGDLDFAKAMRGKIIGFREYDPS